MCAWFGWNVACGQMSGTFEPDPDHSPDAGTRLLCPISHRLGNFPAFPTLPASCTAMRNFTLRKIAHIHIGSTPLERAVVLNGFIHWVVGRPLSEVNTCALPSARTCSLTYCISMQHCRDNLIGYLCEVALFWMNQYVSRQNVLIS